MQMQRLEYKVIHVNWQEAENELNRWAGEGWQVQFAAEDRDDPTRMRFVMARMRVG